MTPCVYINCKAKAKTLVLVVAATSTYCVVQSVRVCVGANVWSGKGVELK